MTEAVTHVVWQQQVIDLAHALGWSHLHIRRTIGRGGSRPGWTTSTNVKGWPDLWLWRRSRGFVAIECKVGKDKVTPEQEAILDDLALAGARTMVAYPRDWDLLVTLLR